jgi:hypothetical protein
MFALLVLKTMNYKNRGQLFVLAALALAVMIIGVAVLLNSGLFSANIAAQNSEGGVEEPRKFLREAELGTIRVIEYSNYNNYSSYTTLRENLSVGVKNWSSVAHHHRAREGVGVSARASAITMGTRIDQDSDDDFTNRTGSTDWNLTGLNGDGFSEVRQFRINVTNTSLENDPSSGSVFRIQVEPTSGAPPERNIRVYNDSVGLIGVQVRDSSGTILGTCTAPVNDQGRATLYLSSGYIGLDNCEALQFFDAPWLSPYHIEFNNAGSVSGVYELIGQNESDIAPLATSGNYFFQADSGSDPFFAPAIYGATVNISYLSSQARLNGSRFAKPTIVDQYRLRALKSSSGGSGSTTVDPVIAFTNGNEKVRIVFENGTTHNTGIDAKVIGPIADMDNDGTLEVTSVGTNGKIQLIPATTSVNNGDETTFNSAKSSKKNPSSATIGIGDVDGDGTPSVLYVRKNKNEIRRVESGGETAVMFTANNNGADGVLGYDDYDNDNTDEVVYIGGSQEIRYGPSETSTGVGPAINNGVAVGPVATYEGTKRVPGDFGGSNNLGLLDYTGSPVNSMSNGNASKTGMAAADVTGNGELEILFVNSNDGNIYYADADLNGPIKQYDPDGAGPISADDDQGLSGTGVANQLGFT